MRAEASSIACVAHYACARRARHVWLGRSRSTYIASHLHSSLVSKRVRDAGCLASRCAQRHLLSRVLPTTLARRARHAWLGRSRRHLASHLHTPLSSKRVMDVGCLIGCLASGCAQRDLQVLSRVSLTTLARRAARVVRAISRHLASHLLLSRVSEGKGCRLPIARRCAQRHLLSRVSLTTLARRARHAWLGRSRGP